MPKGAEPNAVAASLFFAGAVVGDSLSSIGLEPGGTSAPCSLRGTGLLLALCLSAPHFVRVDKALQTLCWTVALLVVAMLGLHEGDEGTRTGDAYYVTLVSMTSVLVVSFGGIDTMSNIEEGNNEIRGSATALAASFSIYANARLLRAAFVHAAVVRDFKVGLASHGGYVGFTGYAHASLPATLAMSFGGSVGIGAGVTLLMRRSVLMEGLASSRYRLTVILGMCGLLQLVSALAAQLAISTQIDNIPALWGAGACMPNVPECTEAARSRRMALQNTPSASMFVSALGMLLLGFPKERHITTFEEFYIFRWPVETLCVAAVVGVVTAWMLLSTLSFEGDEWYSDWLVIAMIGSVFFSFYCDTGVGQIGWTIAMVVEQGALVHKHGWNEVLTFFTNVTIFVLIGIQVLYIGTATVSLVCSARVRGVLNDVIGGLTVAGLSISLFLYLASASLQMSINGALMSTFLRDTGVRTTMWFTSKHYVPVLLWGAMYACRCEVSILRMRASAWGIIALWTTAVAVNGAIYVLIRVSLSSNGPEVDGVDWWPMSGALLGVLVMPWLGTGLVVGGTFWV